MTSGESERGGNTAYGRFASEGHGLRVMVIDQDADTLLTVQSLIAPLGANALAVGSSDGALLAFAEARPAAVILDLGTTGTVDGLSTLAALKRIDPDVPIIVVGMPRLDMSPAQAMTLGATAFVSKPLQREEFETRLMGALAQRHVTQEVESLRAQLQTDTRFPLLLGNGQLMADVAALIKRVADTDVTVLIRGESGTGKDVVARAIAASSRRRDKPFVKVNLAAIPSELLESELFGYERGAFTSAVQHKPGKFEFANHGTMFLDEVGEIGFAMQAKLLHVLQDGEFSRLGGNRDVHVDVRIIAATNRDLESAVAEGQFRSDLFFRLNVIAITLPPLRDRPADVPLLIEHFLRKYSAQYNRPLLSLSPGVERWFLEYDWPGNVRELENAIRHAVILGTDAPLGKELSATIAAAAARRQMQVGDNTANTPDLQTPPLSVVPMEAEAAIVEAQPPAATPSAPPLGTAPSTASSSPAASSKTPAPEPAYSLKSVAREAARSAERELILQVLQRTRWNRKAAAAILSISYKALLYKIKENGLDLARQL